VNTGRSDMELYMEIEKWSNDASDGVFWDDLTPAGWWEPYNGYHQGNQVNMIRGSDSQVEKKS